MEELGDPRDRPTGSGTDWATYRKLSLRTFIPQLSLGALLQAAVVMSTGAGAVYTAGAYVQGILDAIHQQGELQLRLASTIASESAARASADVALTDLLREEQRARLDQMTRLQATADHIDRAYSRFFVNAQPQPRRP